MNFAGDKAEAIASALQSQAEAPDIKTIKTRDKLLTKPFLSTSWTRWENLASHKGKNMNDNDNLSGIYNDDGTKINPALISKPSLCITCKKDDLREEEILCLLTRNDQAGEKEFKCYAYESKYNK